MTAPAEPRATRQSRQSGNGSGASVDTVSLAMSYDEADMFTVLLAEATAAWEKNCEAAHSSRLNAMHFRTLRNKVRQIREQLPGDYPDVDL